MTVVLLDASRPDLIPAGAVSLLAETVAVTEDVHPSVLWQLPSYVLVGMSGDDAFKTLVTTDREHPEVVERLKWGEPLVEGGRTAGATLLRAVELMDRLRRRGPWERRQTHDSLRRYLLEEVYELLDAIDNGTPDELRSELGDLLLQVLFHARIAADSASGSFDIDDVAQSFIDKISSRTPGVLSGDHEDLGRQIDEWEAAKVAERNRGRVSVLDGIPTTQPALALVQKIFERLASVDFPVAAVSPSLYRVDIPFQQHATVSVEDDLRQRALVLMSQVRAAEAAAAADGVQISDENTWRKYLGMDYVDEGAAAGDDADAVDAGDTPDDEVVEVDVDADAEDTDAADADADDDLDWDATATDAEPSAPKKKSKSKKSKGLKTAKVPGMVVHEKWSAAGE